MQAGFTMRAALVEDKLSSTLDDKDFFSSEMQSPPLRHFWSTLVQTLWLGHPQLSPTSLFASAVKIQKAVMLASLCFLVT